MFALAKNTPPGKKTVTELENLQFLLTASHHFPDTKNHDLTGISPRPDCQNAGDRHELATGLFDFFLTTLPEDLDPITVASSNVGELKLAVHKLHGNVRDCGVQRLIKAI